MTFHPYPLVLTTPVMTPERFVELSGLTDGTVRGQMQRGQLPVIKIGNRNMINLALMAWEDTPVLNLPVTSKERFSEASGLTERTIEGMFYRGELPERNIGRRSLVDVAELTRQCMANRDDFQIANA